MDSMQSAIQAKGETIFNLMEGDTKSIFSKDYWNGRIMEWSMKNEHFKIQMFRFVDVLPNLQSGSEVARHLKEYFAESGDELPSVFNFGVGLGSLAPGLMAGTIRKNVVQMAKMFISGESPDEALPVLKKSRKNKIAFTADLLGEACLSESEARDYTQRYMELVDWLSKDARSWEHVPQIDEDNLGPIPKVNVSVKLSSLFSQIDVKAYEKSKNILKERVRPIFKQAMTQGAFINLDMEQFELRDLTLDVFEELLTEPEFSKYPHWGCVIQAYLKDSLKDCERMVQFAKRRQVPFTVRLVKGAYWDYETIHSKQMGWPCPVFENKMATDANYEACALLLLQNSKFIKLALGSHNVRSISAALVHAERLGVDPKAFEVQMLYGMADAIKSSLAKMGIRVREYAPIGEMIPGMAYLVRRLLENTSNESFLRSKFSDGNSNQELLKDPREKLAQIESNAKTLAGGAGRGANTDSDSGRISGAASSTIARFSNEPFADFGILENRKKIEAAIADWKKRLGKDYGNIIDGTEVKNGRWIESVNPAEPTQVLGRVSSATVAEATQALNAASRHSLTWKKTSSNDRAALLERLAELMIRDRMRLASLQVLEVGKQWEEADADVAEAIDFCRYYAREMRRLANPQKTGHLPGEDSYLRYEGRGVAVVIAPWNFPLAILCGMATAALVTGNTVILKPAEQSCITGVELMRLMNEAGVPKGVVQLLNGYGEEIGDTLTQSPLVHVIAFTGSKNVGLHILKNASVVQPGQKHIKKVICELGGKNAVIVDNDADLDEAVVGVLNSAFGFQGQKCSACSRVIVLEEIYEKFVGRLLEAGKSIFVANAEVPDSFVGPVIDEEAQTRILKMIEVGKSEARLAMQVEVPKTGYYVPPTIFVDVNPKAKIAQEEIFGPVLAVIKTKSIESAIEIANDVDYALTGGVFSRSPANIEKIKAGLEVGNLYINRGITGALVERHPFGGFKLSGGGTKAGGPDYLLNFVEPRAVAENTLRRGFAPQT